MNRLMFVLIVVFVILALSGFGAAALTREYVNHPPYTPSNYYPDEDPVDVDANLGWDGGDPDAGDTVAYDVYLGRYSPPPKVATVGPYPANQTQIEYDPGTLEYCSKYYMMIAAWDNHNASATGPVSTFTTTCENHPPDPPHIDGPTNGHPGVEYEFTFILMDDDCDDMWLFVDWDDGTFVEDLGPFAAGEEIILSHSWSENGTYTIGAKAEDFFNESWWAWYDIKIGNEPPNKPTIDGPTTIYPGTYKYTFKATDPDGDNITYEIRWGDGTSEKWIGPYNSGEEVIRNHTFYDIGTATIKARANDTHGAIGEWGEILVHISKSTQQSCYVPGGQDSLNENSDAMEINNEEVNKEIDPQPNFDLISRLDGPDTYVSHQNPDENYAYSKVIRISNEYGVDGSPGWANVAYIEFYDLINLGGRANIVSAELNFYYDGYEGNDPAGRELNVYRVTEYWDWRALTWNDQPSYETEPIASATVPSSTGKWITWDVTSDIRNFVDEWPPYFHQGYRISDDGHWGQPDVPTTMVRSVDSDEESSRPYLLVISRVSRSQQSGQQGASSSS